MTMSLRHVPNECSAIATAALLGLVASTTFAQVTGVPKLFELVPGPAESELLAPSVVGERAFFLRGDGATLIDVTARQADPLELPGDRTIDGGNGRAVTPVGPSWALLRVRVGPPDGPDLRRQRPRETWLSDGTQLGTVLLRGVDDDRPVFLNYSEGLGAYLRGTPLPDGRLQVVTGSSPTGTAASLGVFDTFPREVLHLSTFTVLENREGLWRSDGTEAGTIALGRLQPSYNPQRRFTTVGDSAYYFAQRPGEPFALWETALDGTASRRVADVPGGGAPRWLFTPGRRSYFTLLAPETFRPNLWSVDLVTGARAFLERINDGVPPFVSGDRLVSYRREAVVGEASLEARTQAGESLVLAPCCEITPRPVFSSDPLSPRDREFFQLDHPSFGREWWVTDGTQSGTHVVVDACPGPCDGGLWLESTERVGPHLVFTGRRDVEDGPRQVFLFNEATRRLEQVTDFRSSAPANEGGVQHLRVGSHILYMTARDDAHGLEPWALDATPVPSCEPSSTVLCLDEGRFAVTAKWKDFTGGSGNGVPRPLTQDTGSFWFFDQENLELIIKVLDGTTINDRHWVFYGSLSNVEFELEVADTLTGERATYSNPGGRFASIGDTEALPSSPFATPRSKLAGHAAASMSSCGDPGDLCLAGRFAVNVSWRDFESKTGTGQPIPLTRDTGAFWFFDEDNIELVLKVLDGTGVNGNFWVFYGALSNVAFDVTVTDELTGQVVTYENPSGTFASVGDDQAFPPQP